MATQSKKKTTQAGDAQAPEGSWAWFKEWTGYVVTVLPYVSAGLVLIPQLSVPIKAAILFVFVVIVVAVRIVHEKAGEEITSGDMKQKRP